MENKLRPQNVRMNTLIDALSDYSDIFNKGFSIDMIKAKETKQIITVKKTVNKSNNSLF